VIVYAESLGPRLRYITEFIGLQMLGKPLVLTSDMEVYRKYERGRINYSSQATNIEEIRITPHPLLSEQGVSRQQVVCTRKNGRVYFFQTAGELSFDLFAASFYLLSRYEEYLPHEKDEYGRYAHQNSLAFREGFLDMPLVNVWIGELEDLIRIKFPSVLTAVKPKSLEVPSFIPTYDIDEAWAFRHKSWWRTMGASLRDLLKGNLERYRLRRAVLKEKAVDPYDSFDWITELHRKVNASPRFFFLVASKNGKYDKNNLPHEIAFQQLVRRIAEHFPVGLHPSWQSGDEPGLLAKEKESLERMSGRKIIASRQHYIRFSLPGTYRSLIGAGIEEDYSMGYGSINGFRASVASPFYWYDLDKEIGTALKLFPFCFMEANAFFEEKQMPQQALLKMQEYRKLTEEAGGSMITIWHNTFLGTEPMFSGWREVYGEFLVHP
jgi:hypothetical protein